MAAKTPVPGTDDKMRSVKAAWDKAPEGARAANAPKHGQAAEKARQAKNDAACVRERDAAAHALA